MQRVAFFDIDGTIFRSSLLIELVEGLIREGVFPLEAREEYISEHEAWLNREGRYEEYIAAVIAVYMKYLVGTYYGDMADVGRRVVAVQSRHVYQYTKQLLKSLRAQNYYVIAISQSPKTILDDFCRQYGFSKVYGRMYELGPQDRFTGKVTDLHLIENKANIIKRVFETNPGLTTEESIAVGDTEGDISLLEAVEHPICFNPNLALYTHAKRMKWEIVLERKDVIYHL